MRSTFKLNIVYKRLPTGQRFTDQKLCPVESGVSLDIWVTQTRTIVSAKELSLQYKSSFGLPFGDITLFRLRLYRRKQAGQLSRYSDQLLAGRSGGSNPGEGEIFLTCQDRPWGPPSLLYNGYHVFPGDKERPGRDADPSPPSSAVGHERVELCLCSP